MAKKKKKSKAAKKAKTTAKKAKKVAVAPVNIEAPEAEMMPASFKVVAGSSEDRFPAEDRIHDILHRKINGRDVWKIVPKGGSWNDG
jgi:hypothetical protein